MAAAISISNFNKSFAGKQVITDLSFEVQEGEIFAFLGANGSGKTTTIRSLLGIYQPDSGDLTVFGEKYDPNQAGLLGYLPEERGLYTSSRVLETMVYFGQIKGMSAAAATQKAIDYLDMVDLADKHKTEIKKLSSGQQQKVQLGVTIINDPKVLILDEPTKGLDPVNRALLMDILTDLNQQGATIIFSTHQMEMAERIADRMVMIKNGKRELYGQVNDVRQSFGDNTIHLEFKGKLEQNSKLFSAQVDKNKAELTPTDGVSTQEILKALTQQQLEIIRFDVSAPSLQEIFVKVTNSHESK